MNLRVIGFLILAGVVFVPDAFSNPDQAKLYKQVFGGDKPKCIICHVDKIPKKGDGKHELNDYGKKVKAAQAAKAVPDEAAYREAGPAPG